MARKPKTVEVLESLEATDSGLDDDRDQDSAGPGVSESALLNELFGPEEDANTLRVIRQAPVHHEGQRISGYCGTIPWGEDVQEYMLRTWGGGIYSVGQYRKNKFLQSRLVQIAGLPLVSPPSRVPAISQPNRNPVNVGGVEISGVPLDGDDQLFFRRIERMMLVQAFLERMKGTDINTVLAGKLVELSSNAKTGLGDINGVLELIDRLKGSGGNGGGASWMDLALKGIEGFTALVKKAEPAAPALPISRAPALPAAEPVEPVKSGVELMSVMQIANAAVATIAAAYMEQPSYSIEDTVAVLRQTVPESVIPAIRDNRAVLWSMAKLALHNLAEPSESLDSGFQVYYDQVFEVFSNGEKPVTSKGGNNDGTPQEKEVLPKSA